MDHSYHGDTIGAMSVGARGVFNRPYSPLLFDVDRIPFPAEGQEQQCIDALERHCYSGDAAAFIVEPLILGAGGMLIYPSRVLRELRRVCADHGVLFIADEVMTGWGRTGNLFACERADVVPDIMCLSKGITGGAVPLAVTLATSALYDAHWSDDPGRQFFHSSSYTANPIACAAALANLAIWCDEPVIERIEAIVRREAAWLERLARLADVSGARQLGTIVALDVSASSGVHYLSQIGLDLRRFFTAADVLIRPLGNTIYLMPPYSIGEADLDRLFEVIGQAITDVVAGRF
jgi:adenosylmethionine-8-amino-7-oxononanoate aminotransferase